MQQVSLRLLGVLIPLSEGSALVDEVVLQPNGPVLAEPVLKIEIKVVVWLVPFDGSLLPDKGGIAVQRPENAGSRLRDGEAGRHPVSERPNRILVIGKRIAIVSTRERQPAGDEVQPFRFRYKCE